MKKLIPLFCLLFICQIAAQNKSLKQFNVSVSDIEIATEGLDEIILENSETNKITVFLDDQNSFSHSIFSSEEGSVLKINFQSEVSIKGKVFRKFITERVNRATARIRIPKHKNITFLGNEIDIISKNYVGDISIFIEKGEIKLGKIQGNTSIKMYSGNISATKNNQNLEIKTSTGNILIDDKLYQKIYKKEVQNSAKNFVVNSIKANVVLNTKKTQ